MKKIINGRLYSTHSAIMLSSRDNGYYADNAYWLQETLYLKKTGEFFLHCEGGGLSKYAASYGNHTSSGEVIRPLTVDEAKRWAEQYCSVDTYLTIFGLDVSE